MKTAYGRTDRGLYPKRYSSIDIESPNLTVKDRLIYSKDQVQDTLKRIFPYVLVGVGIGALIHNWIPGNPGYRD